MNFVIHSDFMVSPVVLEVDIIWLYNTIPIHMFGLHTKLIKLKAVTWEVNSSNHCGTIACIHAFLKVNRVI